MRLGSGSTRARAGSSVPLVWRRVPPGRTERRSVRLRWLQWTRMCPGATGPVVSDGFARMKEMRMGISSIAEIIAEIGAGRMVVLVDEEDRENEGDLLMAAEFVTPEAINFMAKHGRGLICLTLTEERCRQLDLRLMVGDNRSRMGTNFTLSIEAASGVTTGISAADRARTVQAAVKKDAK